MPPRFFVDLALAEGAELALPAAASRHAQVLRLQPCAPLILFDGRGGQWAAEVLEMGRKSVLARVLAHQAIERELAGAVTLALGMPANERMDTLVEKATELGVAALQPLVCQRSVLRVAGERAERKAAHWQAIAAAACEQSGRNRVPAVAAPIPLRDWLGGLPAPCADQPRWLLSLAAGAAPLPTLLCGLAQAGAVNQALSVAVLSGPEGGLTDEELAAAQACGFAPVSLGPRVLRADTAPLAVLACLALLSWQQGSP